MKTSNHYKFFIMFFATFGCTQPESNEPDASDGTVTTDTHPINESDETPTDSQGRFAVGIQIDRVEANQGVAVRLVDEGKTVEPVSRNAGLIYGRPMLIRAYWTINNAWAQRDILAELILHYPDGSTETQQNATRISGPSDPNTMEGAFNWLLEAEKVQPGLQFAIELKETAHSEEGTATPNKGARVPQSDTIDLDINDQEMTMDITLVPMTPPNGEALDITAADQTAVETALMEMLPIQSIVVDWQPTTPQSKIYEHPEEAWNDIHDLRATMNLGPNQYLHILLDPNHCCNSAAFDFTGLGGNPDATQSDEDTNKRSAMVMIQKDVESAAPFIVHELGHNHGLAHAPCGDVDDPDPNYPYPEGLSYTQGYGIISNKLYSGDPGIAHPYYDIMTYCWPVWFSDYHFEKLRKRIQIVSSW